MRLVGKNAADGGKLRAACGILPVRYVQKALRRGKAQPVRVRKAVINTLRLHGVDAEDQLRFAGLQPVKAAVARQKGKPIDPRGNAPVIVMPDVDLDEVAANIVAKKTGFAGQTCVNYNRIYVQERIYPQLCEKVAEKLRAVKLGQWKDEGQVMGPLINKKARDRMLELVDDAVKSGAKLVMGGEVPEDFAKGAYMTPALLVDVTDDMRVSKEEIFGPIIPMQPFKTLDEAIEKANNTIYGLSSYFFGHNAKEISKAFEGMEAGEIFINGSGGTEQTPHAGVKQSGVGCDKSPWSLEEYFDFKYCAMIP